MSAAESDKISELPREVLILIVQKISHPETLKKLCRVSRLFHSLVIPQLYESIVLSCSKSSDPYHSQSTQSSKDWHLVEFGTNLRHIKDLEIRRKIYATSSKCWHMKKDEEMESDERTHHDTKYRRVQSQVFYEACFETFCRRLRRNTLRSFSWHLGSCAPDSLLSPGGYLPQFQTSLEYLSLITDPDCYEHVHTRTKYDLAAFNNLRELSWVGPQTLCDFAALKNCLQVNAPHLETLSLDLPYWGQKSKENHNAGSQLECFDAGGFVRTNVLHLYTNDEHGNSATRFPTLQNLSLSRVNIYDAQLKQMPASLSFCQLKSLKLWDCANTESMLSHLTEFRQCPQLRRLEILSFLCFKDDEVLASFLDTLSFLERVFLSIPWMDWNSVGSIICDHIPTLKQVVFHDRILERVPSFAGDEDQINDQSVGYFEGLETLLTESECEIIGLSYDLDELRHDLEHNIAKISCKLLHVRAAGEEIFTGPNKLDGFASWIFGPTGIPGLLVLAHGDFAFQEGNNFLYCQNDVVGLGQPAFRQVTSSDTDLWELVQRNMNALTACPYRSIQKHPASAW